MKIKDPHDEACFESYLYNGRIDSCSSLLKDESKQDAVPWALNAWIDAKNANEMRAIYTLIWLLS